MTGDDFGNQPRLNAGNSFRFKKNKTTKPNGPKVQVTAGPGPWLQKGVSESENESSLADRRL